MANDLVLRVSLPDEPAGVIASGGQVNQHDGYIVHTFTSSSTFQLTNTNAVELEVFMVGGGAGGGGGVQDAITPPFSFTGGGGGGAGGLVLIPAGNFTLSSGSY